MSMINVYGSPNAYKRAAATTLLTALLIKYVIKAASKQSLISLSLEKYIAMIAAKNDGRK